MSDQYGPRGGQDDPAVGAPRLTFNTGNRPDPIPDPAPAPTTDNAGAPTAALQNKVIAFLLSSAGLTVVGAVITGLTGLQVDPTVLLAVVGGVITLVSTAAGYLTRNSTKAN